MGSPFNVNIRMFFKDVGRVDFFHKSMCEFDGIEMELWAENIGIYRPHEYYKTAKFSFQLYLQVIEPAQVMDLWKKSTRPTSKKTFL